MSWITFTRVGSTRSPPNSHHFRQERPTPSMDGRRRRLLRLPCRPPGLLRSVCSGALPVGRAPARFPDVAGCRSVGRSTGTDRVLPSVISDVVRGVDAVHDGVRVVVKHKKQPDVRELGETREGGVSHYGGIQEHLTNIHQGSRKKQTIAAFVLVFAERRGILRGGEQTSTVITTGVQVVAVFGYSIDCSFNKSK